MVAKRNDRANEDDYDSIVGWNLNLERMEMCFGNLQKAEIYIQVKKAWKDCEETIETPSSGGTFQLLSLVKYCSSCKNQEEEMTEKNTINGMPDISAILKTI